MPLTLVAHRQIRRQKCSFKYSSVINILRDVIADVVDVNVKTLTSVFMCQNLWNQKCGRRIAQTIRSGEHSNSLFTVVIAFENSRRWAPERSRTNLLGADWSRRYWSCYRIVSRTIVAHCCNRRRTHWASAPLWLMFLVLHVAHCWVSDVCFVIELGQQK